MAVIILTSITLCLKVIIECCFDIYCIQLQEEDVHRNVMKRGTLTDIITARDPQKSY